LKKKKEKKCGQLKCLPQGELKKKRNKKKGLKTTRKPKKESLIGKIHWEKNYQRARKEVGK